MWMSSERKAGSDVTHELVRHIGTFSEKENGWCKELNIVSWNNAKPKYDIREWSPDHKLMSRGITLTEEDAKRLSELLQTESF